jgi:hypothetical protein
VLQLAFLSLKLVLQLQPPLFKLVEFALSSKNQSLKHVNLRETS